MGKKNKKRSHNISQAPAQASPVPTADDNSYSSSDDSDASDMSSTIDQAPAANAGGGAPRTTAPSAAGHLTAVQLIQDLLSNGPIEVSQSIGTDRALVEVVRITDMTDDGVIGAATGGKHTAAEVKGFTAIANGMVLALLNDPQMIDRRRFDGTAASSAAIDRAQFTTTQDCIQMGLALHLATKLQFWSTNHHVGIGSLQGFPLKLARTFSRIIDFDPESEAVCSVIHALSHGADTRVCLAGLGFAGIDTTAQTNNSWSLGKDFLVRRSATPAGGAKPCDVLTAARMFKRTSLSNWFECPEDVKDQARYAHAIMANPAAYHIGAKYLTGHEPKTVPDPLPETAIFLKTFLQTVFPKSTLCKAQIFMTAAVDRSLAAEMRKVIEGTASNIDEEALAKLANTGGHAPSWNV